MPEKHTFVYGKNQIEYTLLFDNRKNITISVLPSKEVQVKAPLNSDIAIIHKRIQNKASWIVKQVRFFDQYHPLQPEREYVSGETHYYLGRQYRLRVRKGSEETVKLIGKFFMAYTKNPDDKARVKFLMLEWYANHAKAFFDERIKYFFDKIPAAEFNSMEISYKYLNKQWGLKNADGSITFNIELMKTPIQCIDYVIVHELCHTIYPNHDDDFYRLLSKVLPDWHKRKERLEYFGAK